MIHPGLCLDNFRSIINALSFFFHIPSVILRAFRSLLFRDMVFTPTARQILNYSYIQHVSKMKFGLTNPAFLSILH